MPYDFSIDKKTGVILIAGYALVGVLLFVAGFLLGIEYRFSSRPADLMVQSSPAKSPQASSEAPAAKPTEQSAQVSPPPTAQAQPVPTPVLTPTPLDEQPPASTAPNASLETGPSASASPTNNTPQAAVQPPVIPPAPISSASAPQVPAQATSSATEAAAASPPILSASEREYAIQVGAFLDPGNAARLAKDLQGKGYKATVFNATDSRYRVWHAVRIGPFKDMQTASREARSFKETEQLLALVRPANTL